MDLFDDLPEPTHTSAPVCAARPPSTKEEEQEEEQEVKRSKRRRDDAEQEEQQEEEQEEEEEERGEIKKVCKEGGPGGPGGPGVPVLRGYVAARRGERDEMQDAHVLLPDLSTCLPDLPGHVSRLSYFAVFDGHGGARASRFAAENLHLILAKKFPRGEAENMDKLVRRCLLDTFRQTDEEFLKKASSQKPAWKDGSTATCVLVVDHVVYVANLGDSRVRWDRLRPPQTASDRQDTHQAVLCRMEASGAAGGPRRPVTLSLSKEHNPTIYEERMRIQRAGGTVRDGRVLGVLEVSRSIGDGQYKRCGVISTPDLKRIQLSADDRFIILACDGLFKVFSPDEAVKFVLGVLQEGGVQQRPGLTDEELRFDSACQQLASEAVRRGCADNVTVILLSVGL